MIESQIKGEKVGDMNPQVSCHLKNSTKPCFFGNKSPETKGCYILPPTVFGTFFDREKVVLCPLRARHGIATHIVIDPGDSCN